jgi:hypothetical protein
MSDTSKYATGGRLPEGRLVVNRTEICEVLLTPEEVRRIREADD